MTQALNLANFSNNLDSSGQVSPEAFSGTVPISKGGTNATTAADARTNLGLGSLAVQNSDDVNITGGSVSGITDLAIADGGTGASTASAARTKLGLVIGSDVLGYVAPGTSGNILRSNGSSWTSTALTSLVGLNMGAGTVSANASFNATTGPTGKLLIELSAHMYSTYGNFGSRTFGIKRVSTGIVLASRVLRFMEWDSRVSGDGATVSYYLSSLDANTAYAFQFYVASGPGVVDNGYYSWWGA